VKTISMSDDEYRAELSVAKGAGFNDGYQQALQYVSDVLAGAPIRNPMLYQDAAVGTNHKELFERLQALRLQPLNIGGFTYGK
jgi:hypothetical protein